MEESDPSTELSSEIACIHDKCNVRKMAYQALFNEFQKLHSFSEKWSTYKNIIPKIALESSPSIREQALGVVLLFVQKCGTAKETAREVMSSLLEKIPVNDEPKTMELLMQIILRYVEIGSSEEVVMRLMSTASAVQSAEVPTACVKIITNILSRFGPKPLDVKYIMESIPNFLAVGELEFRTATKTLILELYRWLGRKAVPNVENILIPAEIEEVLKEYEDTNRTEPPKSIIRSVQDESKPGGSVSCEITISMEPVAKGTFNLFLLVNDEFFLKLGSHDWTERKDALLELQNVLGNCPKLQPANYDQLLSSLKKIITEDQCVIVVGFAIACVTSIAKGLQHNFSSHALSFCRILLEKFVEKRQHITEQLREALDVVTATTSFDCLIKTINGFLDNRNPTIRLETIQLLIRLFYKSTRQTLKKTDFAVLYQSLANCLHHSQLIIREKSLMALGVAIEIAGEEVINSHLENVDPITKNRIKNCKRASDSFGEKYNQIRHKNVKKELQRKEEILPGCKKHEPASNKMQEAVINCEKVNDKRNDIKLSGEEYVQILKSQNSGPNEPNRPKNNNTENKIKLSGLAKKMSSESSFEWYHVNPTLENENNLNNVQIDFPERKRESDEKSTKKMNSSSTYSPNNKEILDVLSLQSQNTFNKMMKESGKITLVGENIQSTKITTKSTNLSDLHTEHKDLGICLELPPETGSFKMSDSTIDSTKSGEELKDSKQRVCIETISQFITDTSESSTKRPLLHSNQSLAVGKNCEGFIMLTENEVKKLLGLRNNSSISNDSSYLFHDFPSRRNLYSRSYKMRQEYKNCYDKQTQTPKTLTMEETNNSSPLPSSNQAIRHNKVSKAVDVTATQTSNFGVDRATETYQIKRLSRGTQWMMLLRAETMTQTSPANAVDTGPLSGSWSTVARPHNNRQNLSCHHQKASEVNMKSIVLKEIEFSQSAGKEVRRDNRISVGTDPPSRRILGSKRTMEINSITLTRTNPIEKGFVKIHSKLQNGIKPKKKKTRSYDVTRTSTKGRTQGIIYKEQLTHNKYNAREQSTSERSFESITVGSCEELTKMSARSNMSRKETKREIHCEVVSQTSGHTSCIDVPNNHFQNCVKQKNIHLNCNERTVRLRKIGEESQCNFKGKRTQNKKGLENSLLNSLKVEKSTMSLVKPHSTKRHKSHRIPNLDTNVKSKKHCYNDTSSGSFQEGCNLIPLMAKGIKHRNMEWKNKRRVKEHSRTHVFKPPRNGKNREYHYIRDHLQTTDDSVTHTTKLSSGEGKNNRQNYRMKRKPRFEDGVRGKCDLDPETKQLVVKELLKICDISQAKFEKMVRQKSSRPCLFTPRAILQRVNELSNPPDQSELSSDARPDSSGKETRGCVIM